MKNEWMKRVLGAAAAALLLGSLTVSGIERASAAESAAVIAADESDGQAPEAPLASDTVVQTPAGPSTGEAEAQVPETDSSTDTTEGTQPPSDASQADSTDHTETVDDTDVPDSSSDSSTADPEGDTDTPGDGTDEAGPDDDADTPDEGTDEAGPDGDADTPGEGTDEAGPDDDADTPGDGTDEAGTDDDTDDTDADDDADTSDDGDMAEDTEDTEEDDTDSSDSDITSPDSTLSGSGSSGASDAYTPDEENPAGKSGSSEAAVPFVQDDSRDARYEERSYDPSEAFLAQGEKIKYSTDMPLDNIPAFITPEMVIGALKVQDTYGYPASVTIAQIIQESGFGTYGPYGEEGQGLSYLAYQYNNLFGIKGTGPAGSVSMRTGEETASGERYTIQAGFRVYHTYTEAIEDRAELLKNSYSDLIEGVNDANTFAVRIGSRWATDIDYAFSLIQQMETYDLYRLDRMTLGEFADLLGEFADPCPGSSVTSRFGWRESTNSYHRGIDLGTGTENIPTYAVAAGTVITAGWDDSAGWWIAIDHGDGLVTKYMHHKELYVQVGDQVEKGQQIGLSGTTGNSTGNHLHFQMEINGAAVDPEPYLFPEGAGD